MQRRIGVESEEETPSTCISAARNTNDRRPRGLVPRGLKGADLRCGQG